MRSWQPKSLQRRLMLGAGLVIALGLVLASLLVHAAANSALNAEFDQSLLSRVQSLAVLVEDTEEGIDVEFSERDFAEFNREDAPDYFQVWHSDGTTLAKSSQLGARDLIAARAEKEQHIYTEFHWPGEATRRQITVGWYPTLDHEEEEDDTVGKGPAIDGDAARSEVLLTIALARSTENVQAQLSRLGWLLMVVGTLVTTACLAGLHFAIRRGLHPVHVIAKQLSTIDETRLTEQIEPQATPLELVPIVNQLNELLGRLETAFHRERDFSNNVAHELRTPLAGLKSTIEVHLARSHEPAEYHEALESCLAICDQSANMVESLLALSRSERKQGGIAQETVQLDQLLSECWAPLDQQSQAKGLAAVWNISPTKLETDREKLRVVLRNVLANAVSHSNANGTVEVSTVSENGSIHIRVANSGNRLNQAAMDRVFDRFWRGDASRNGTGEHFGLGLTLVKSLTELLGGKIQVDGNDDRFEVSLKFPPNPPISYSTFSRS